MATNVTGKEKLDGVKQPSLPFAPVEYSREYQDKLHNLLRLYFTSIDGFAAALLDTRATRFLSAPQGAFQDNVSHSIAANTPTVMPLNTVDFANGISIVSGTKITVENAGIYNLQWSGQFKNADSSVHDVSVWLRKDGAGPGVDIPGSKGVITIPARKSSSPGEEGKIIAGWNYFVELQAGEFVELWWATDSNLVSMPYIAATTTPYASPSAASLIVTMSYVSRL